jgi:hypothetical protein
METAYSYGPHMLAHDKRIFDTPLDEQLRMRTPEITVWNTTMFPVINESIRDAQAQITTGHGDIRAYTTDRTISPTEPTTNATTNVTRETQALLANSNASTASATASSREVTTLRIRRLPFSALQNRLQQARSHLATIPAIATSRAPRETQATLANPNASTASVPASTRAATNIRTLRLPFSALRKRLQQARFHLATIPAVTATVRAPSTARTGANPSSIRRRVQQARTQAATLNCI